MKRIIVTLVLVVGIAASLAAFDGMGERNGWQGRKHQNQKMMMNQKMQHHGMGNPMGMLCENLDLSEAQEAKIEDLRNSYQKDMIQLHADIQVLNINKRSALRDKDFAKAKKVIGKVYELKEKQEIKIIEHHEAVWNELTPEQQKEAKNMQPEKMHRNKMNGNGKQFRNWDDED